jgi:phosphoglycerate dehydrogenase-like enzyme
LLKEFPQLLFLTVNDVSYRKLQKHQWENVEIIYGNYLNKDNLSHAPSLRWIHATGSQLNHIDLEEVRKRGSIIVSRTPDENIDQIGEFVLGGFLTFAKNFIHWTQADQFPALLWESKWRDDMWTLKGRTLIQVGLGRIGTEIARRAKELGMTVWGVEEKKNFHPHCNKTFAFKDLHAVLPAADIVSLALPTKNNFEKWFGRVEIEKMRKDSILSVVGDHNILDAEALAESDSKGKFRGVIIDATFASPIPHDSPVWKVRNKIITPEASPWPKSKEQEAFRLFVYNLRQYLHGNFKDFRFRVDLD